MTPYTNSCTIHLFLCISQKTNLNNLKNYIKMNVEQSLLTVQGYCASYCGNSFIILLSGIYSPELHVFLYFSFLPLWIFSVHPVSPNTHTILIEYPQMLNVDVFENNMATNLIKC